MAGFLDQYGAADERRGKIIKTLVISLLTLVVVGGAGHPADVRPTIRRGRAGHSADARPTVWCAVMRLMLS